ncbi:hypothetical protein DYB32_005588 [Aphanomyces invadans]|uniref:Uncharacterized protein n=2 Tax=Aphanomyces invadans TaxID=157072 RepID=A0A3R6VWC3_9STRA|nr:hypothetical protein DYB32_005588 [Aphanomyces invadans]
MLATGFGVSAYRLFTIPREPYRVQVPQVPKNIPLLVFRIAIFSFFLVVFLIRMAQTNLDDLFYYTYWNFTIQTIYVGWAIVYQIQIWFQPKPVHANGWLNATFDVAFTSCAVVVSVYWFVLYKPTAIVPWTTYVVHGVNLILLLIEFAFNEHLVQRNNMKFVIMWPALYGSVTWITMATGLNDKWPYDLLDVTKPYAPLKWFGIVFSHAVFFGAVLLLSLLKVRIVGEPAPAVECAKNDKVTIQVVPNSFV